MLSPREGSLWLAAFGTLRIVCEPIAANLAWNLIFGIYRSSVRPNRSSWVAEHSSPIVSHHAARLIHRDCVALNFTTLAISTYGIFCSIGNRRLPFSPAYGATAFSSAASPFTGGYSPMWCLNAAK